MRAPKIAQHPSPNYGPRREGLRPELIVIHYTAMHDAQAALARLCDPIAQVSAHYLISAMGQITQMVPETERAWHAGEGEWQGRGDINSRSIGIELDNRGNRPFPEPQMAALETLLCGIMVHWEILPEGVIGHSDMTPGRKTDPGRHFDWQRLERQGLSRARGLHCVPNSVTPEAFRAAAVNAGYTAQVDDKALLEAVRLRHCPWRRGALSVEDLMPLLPNGSKSPPEDLNPLTDPDRTR